MISFHFLYTKKKKSNGFISKYKFISLFWVLIKFLSYNSKILKFLKIYIKKKFRRRCFFYYYYSILLNILV